MERSFTVMVFTTERRKWISMRDLRNGEYLSPVQHSGDNKDDTVELKGDFTWVTHEEYNRKIKELERKIALLESKIQNLTMVY